MAKSKSYETILLKSLSNPKEALAYLNAALQECTDGSPESQKLLLMALKNVSLAHGSMQTLAQKTGLGRESLYKTLSKHGNPKLSTLTTIISALGFDLKVSLPAKR